MSDCILGLAEAMINSLDSPSGLTTGQVYMWITTNYGQLTTLVGTCHSVDGSGCFTPPLNAAESGIFQELYKIKYYNSQASANLGAAAYDWSEVREGDSTVRRVSRNEVSKTFLSLSREAQAALNELILWYRTNGACPLSVSSPYAMSCETLRYDDGNGNQCGC